MKKENRKGKALQVVGIIMQGIGALFLLAMISVFINERSTTDWTGAGLGAIGLVALIVVGRILANKHS
jgi:divalent metal cation (Fe/Co/Zn/Cd) transporter